MSDVVAKLLQNFFRSFQRTRSVEVGKDYLGNKYFEYVPDKSSSKRKRRWMVSNIEDELDQKVPPEWDHWLRYRRRDAPTTEEIENALRKQKIFLENIRKIKEAEIPEHKAPEKASAFPELKDLPRQKLRKAESLDETPPKKLE